MDFETKAQIDEYVIGGGNTGVFTGDDTTITYTPENPAHSPLVSIPTHEISSITFRRDTTLLRSSLLGWFFAGITLVLIVVVYFFTFAGSNQGLTNPDVNLTTLMLLLFIVGGVTTTYEYFNGEEYDVIIAVIETEDDDSTVLAGRIQNTEFVEACGELLESDLETRNQNAKLKSELAKI